MTVEQRLSVLDGYLTALKLGRVTISPDNQARMIQGLCSFWDSMSSELLTAVAKG